MMNFGLGCGVVLNLIDRIPRLEDGSHPLLLAVDNYFNSFVLIQQCSLRGIPIVGTLRADRIQDAPPISNKTTMEKKSRGAFEVVHYSLDKAETCVVSWKDNGIVIMGSNCYGANPIAQAKRWNRIEKRKSCLTCPTLYINTINAWMGLIARIGM